MAGVPSLSSPHSLSPLLPPRLLIRRPSPSKYLSTISPFATAGPSRAYDSRISASHSDTSAKAVVVAGDLTYGNKQVISITPQLYDYILSNTREPQVLRELREETAKMRGSQMQVSPDQAQLLAMLVQLLGAQRCIELGTYTVDVKHALAVDTLKSLILNGESCSYDFAFVDAEKRMYSEYFELLLQLVKVGGIIVMDNVLWHGKVANPLVNDPKTVSIRNFNRSISEDRRVSISMVPIGDGMTICRKR